MPNSLQASSNCAQNSLPQSICMALTLKGILSLICSRKEVAATAVARVYTPTTSHRLFRSRAVKCFSIAPGSDRRPRVSTSTKSPAPPPLTP